MRPSTVFIRIIVSAALSFASCAALAAAPVPRILREPVFGLHYELARVKFDPLPAQALTNCETLADNENLRSVWFLYGQARDDASGRTYYIAGGYDIWVNEQQRYKKFEVEDLGTVFFTEPGKCTTVDSARQIFDDRTFDDEMPEAILKKLAVDVVRRLERAFGGAERLRAELRNQHVDLDSLPPELHDAMKRYFAR